MVAKLVRSSRVWSLVVFGLLCVGVVVGISQWGNPPRGPVAQAQSGGGGGGGTLGGSIPPNLAAAKAIVGTTAPFWCMNKYVGGPVPCISGSGGSGTGSGGCGTGKCGTANYFGAGGGGGSTEGDGFSTEGSGIPRPGPLRRGGILFPHRGGDGSPLHREHR